MIVVFMNWLWRRYLMAGNAGLGYWQIVEVQGFRQWVCVGYLPNDPTYRCICWHINPKSWP